MRMTSKSNINLFVCFWCRICARTRQRISPHFRNRWRSSQTTKNYANRRLKIWTKWSKSWRRKETKYVCVNSKIKNVQMIQEWNGFYWIILWALYSIDQFCCFLCLYRYIVNQYEGIWIGYKNENFDCFILSGGRWNIGEIGKWADWTTKSACQVTERPRR